MIRMAGIFLRNGKWYCRQRKGGRLVVWSLAKFGIKTEAQALKYLAEYQKSALADRLAELDPSTIKLQEFIDKYTKLRQGQIAVSSLARYEVSLKALLAGLGNIALRAITPAKISEWIANRLQSGVTPNGVNADLRHIRAALRHAVDWGMLQQAPKIKMVKVDNSLPRYIEPDELDLILSAEDNPAHRALWDFLLWTGCRRSEALGLQWKDISLTPTPMAKVTGKGRKQRLIPLLPQAVQALGEKKDIGFVFPQVHPDVYTKWWQKLVRKASSQCTTCDAYSLKKENDRWSCQGCNASFSINRYAILAKHRLHDLRHTAATYMIVKGVPLRVVQDILGHADIKTTMHYSKGLAASHLYYTLYEAFHGQK